MGFGKVSSFRFSHWKLDLENHAKFALDHLCSRPSRPSSNHNTTYQFHLIATNPDLFFDEQIPFFFLLQILGALQEQRVMYEKQLHMLRNQMSPSTPYAAYGVFDTLGFRTPTGFPPSSNMQSKVDRWSEDRYVFAGFSIFPPLASSDFPPTLVTFLLHF